MIVGMPGYGLGQAPAAIPEALDAGLMDALRKPARMIHQQTGLGIAPLILWPAAAAAGAAVYEGGKYVWDVFNTPSPDVVMRSKPPAPPAPPVTASMTPAEYAASAAAWTPKVLEGSSNRVYEEWRRGVVETGQARAESAQPNSDLTWLWIVLAGVGVVVVLK